MVDQDILHYLQEGRRRGFAFEVLKRELLKGGFDSGEVEEAVAETEKLESGAREQIPTQTQKMNQLVKKREEIEQMPIKQQEVGMKKDTEKTEEKKEINNKNKNKKKEEKEPVQVVGGEKMGLLKKVGASMVHPSALFKSTKGQGFGRPFGYLYFISLVPFLIFSVATIILLNIFSSFVNQILELYNLSVLGLNNLDILDYAIITGFFVVLFFVVFPLIIFIKTGVLHLFIKLFKGSGKFSDSFAAASYSLTPSWLFIFVYPVTSIWSFVLLIIGLAEMHGFSKLKAFFVIFTNWVFYGLVISGIIMLNKFF